MKKILSLVLALLMTFSAASFVGAAGEAAIAADTTATTTAAATGIHDEAIAFLESYGIYKGTSTTSFEPDAYSDIQRYQMALFVARVSTGWVDDSQWAVYQEWNDGIENRSTFDDLGGTYAEKVFGAISYAAQKGIIEGYGNNKFGPTDGITYQDALTMVVRTLGYKGLAWPWGYIEKAVTLDLTRGIPSTVAYTDILNRGQVAQIIYNALFATTKEGDTLAARNFGGELGWANIIITAVGKAVYTADEKGVDDGIIAFRVVNEDGTLGARYLVKNAQSFNYEKHYERYLGHAYNALFTKDENSEYVTLIGYKDLLVDTVWNFGLPTKVDGNYPITNYVKDYSLVTKFSRDDYLNKWNGDYGWKEFIMKNALEGTTVAVYDRKYGVNWKTGDILVRDDKGTIVAYDADGNSTKWSTAWNWNSVLNVYFETLYKDVNGVIEVVGINILDEEEIKDMVDNSKIQVGTEAKPGLKNITDKDLLKTAYASLDAYVLGPKTTPNYGIFEEYRFGQIELLDEIDHNGHKKAGFALYDLNGITEQIWKGFTKEDFPSLSKSAMKSKIQTVVWEGQCDHGIAKGWYSEDSLVKQADVKSFDYIIYSYDQYTGELKVVKKIYSADDAKADKDNFYGTGVVRAYNVNAKTVTIGDNTYSYDYPELAGNGLDAIYGVSGNKLYDGNGALLDKAAFTYLFKALFNQYVQYVIVDGKLTYIRLSGTEHELIVVDSYAGLSSDGYIVINGYKTDDLTYTQFRIGSYNGWVKGDYYYYPGQAAVDAAFMRGTIYKIASHNGKEDVYYVNTVALRYKNGDNYMTYDFDALKDAGVSGESYKITFKDGYKRASVYDQVNKKWVDKDWEKAGSSDKYVLICNPVGTLGATHGLAGDYAPIIVYTGKADDGWFAQGYRIIDTDATVLINVDFSAVVGFNRDQYDLSYVVFLTYDYETANYDGYDKGNLLHEDWYLLGASEYTARVFDLYTGNIVTKYATNKDLKKGYAYPAVGEWIVMDNRYDARDLNVAIPAAYLSNETGGLYNLNDQYLFGSGFVGTVGASTLFSKDKTSKNILTPKLADINITGGVKGLTGDPSVFLVSTAPASNGELKITELDKVNEDEFNAWVKANNYDLGTMYFWYVHKIGGSTVYYIEKDGAVVIKEDWTLYSDNVVDVSTDVPDHAYIDFKLVAHDAATFVDSTGKKHFLNGAFDEITFNFIGAAVDENSLTDTHHAIDTNDYHFGIWGYCSNEDWETIVGFSGNWAGDANVTTSETNACGIEEFTTEVKDAEATIDALYRVYGCIVEDVYDAHPVEDGTKCNLVRSITIDFDKADARIVDIAADPNVIVSNIKIGLPFKATAVVDAATGEAFVDANGDPVTAVDPSSVVINPIQVSFEFKDSAGTKYEFVIEIKQIKYTVEGYTCYDYTGKFISETITPGPGVVIKAATPDLVDKKDSDGKIQIAAIAPYGWVNKTNDIWG